MITLYRILRSNTPSVLALLFSYLQSLQAGAQSSPDDVVMATPSPSSNLDFFGHPIPSHTPIGISSFNPSPTDQFNGGSPTSTRGPDDHGTDHGILNYYFLLLALLIIVVGIIYLFYMKRQRQKTARTRQNGQRALARDLERWGGGGPWGPGRFRHPRSSPRQPRRDEGLDEQGEAPPPYIPKEPEPAYTEPHRDGPGAGHDVPLHDMARPDQKPPDYNEGPSSVGGPGTAGAGPMMRNE